MVCVLFCQFSAYAFEEGSLPQPGVPSFSASHEEPPVFQHLSELKLQAWMDGQILTCMLEKGVLSLGF